MPGTIRSSTRYFVENTPWCNTLQDAAFSEMNIRDILATNVRKLREAREWSQEELADRAGVDRTYISSIERRKYAVSIEIVDRLARALDMEAADLLKRPISARREKKS
jgi:ribosome-binding protein aMBF1 (putative translation factor)